MKPERLADDRLRVPARAEAEDGTIGDGLIEVGPADPRFTVWDRYLRALEAATE